MKKYLLLVSFFLVLFISTPFVLNAQNLYKQKRFSKKAELEKRELKKFFLRFVKDFETYKDITKIPKYLFASNLKTQLAKNDDWIKMFLSDDVSNQLTESERYEYNITLINMINIGVTLLFHKVKDANDSDLENKDIKNFLLPSTIEIIEKSKWFRHFLNDDDEIVKAKNIDDSHNLINDAKKIFKVLSKELEKTSPIEKANYRKNFTEWHKEINDFTSEICKKENCFGLKENTKIYTVYFLFLDIQIAKLNSQFKIVNIQSIQFD